MTPSAQEITNVSHQQKDDVKCSTSLPANSLFQVTLTLVKWPPDLARLECRLDRQASSLQAFIPLLAPTSPPKAFNHDSSTGGDAPENYTPQNAATATTPPLEWSQVKLGPLTHQSVLFSTLKLYAFTSTPPPPSTATSRSSLFSSQPSGNNSNTLQHERGHFRLSSILARCSVIPNSDRKQENGLYIVWPNDEEREACVVVDLHSHASSNSLSSSSSASSLPPHEKHHTTAPLEQEFVDEEAAVQGRVHIKVQLKRYRPGVDSLNESNALVQSWLGDQSSAGMVPTDSAVSTSSSTSLLPHDAVAIDDEQGDMNGPLAQHRTTTGSGASASLPSTNRDSAQDSSVPSLSFSSHSSSLLQQDSSASSFLTSATLAVASRLQSSFSGRKTSSSNHDPVGFSRVKLSSSCGGNINSSTVSNSNNNIYHLYSHAPRAVFPSPPMSRPSFSSSSLGSTFGRGSGHGADSTYSLSSSSASTVMSFASHKSISSFLSGSLSLISAFSSDWAALVDEVQTILHMCANQGWKRPSGTLRIGMMELSRYFQLFCPLSRHALANPSFTQPDMNDLLIPSHHHRRVVDGRHLTVALYFLKAAMATYGPILTRFCGYGKGYLRDTLRPDATKKTVMETLNLNKEHILIWQYAAVDGANASNGAALAEGMGNGRVRHGRTGSSTSSSNGTDGGDAASMRTDGSTHTISTSSGRQPQAKDKGSDGTTPTHRNIPIRSSSVQGASSVDVSSSSLVHWPSFFLVYDPTIHALVLSVRGTCTIQECLLDVVADYAPFRGGWAHSGVLRLAKWVYTHYAARIDAEMERWQVDVLYLTGHSLGSSVAGVLAHFFSERWPEQGRPWRVETYLFSPPPSISLHVPSWEVKLGKKGWRGHAYVLGEDIVPTISFGSVLDYRDLFVLASRLCRDGLLSTEERMKVLRARHLELVRHEVNVKLYAPSDRIHYIHKVDLSSSSSIDGVSDSKPSKQMVVDIVDRRVFGYTFWVTGGHRILSHHIPSSYDKALRRAIESLAE